MSGPRKHTKYKGFTLSKWNAADGMWVRFVDIPNSGDIEARLNPEFGPPPEGRRNGDRWIFTMHFPRRGEPYIYWPPMRYLTERDLIRAKQRARRMMKALEID